MPIPGASMPIPWGMLQQTATVTTRTAGQETSGAFELTASTTYTVRCFVQPSGSSDSAIYKRETGSTQITIFLAPTTSTGTNTGSIVNHIATLTVDGVVYQVNGEPLNLCSAGRVFQLNVFRET
jgi:hypothetical protein